MLFLQHVYPALFSRGSQGTLQPPLSLQHRKVNGDREGKVIAPLGQKTAWKS